MENEKTLPNNRGIKKDRKKQGMVLGLAITGFMIYEPVDHFPRDAHFRR